MVPLRKSRGGQFLTPLGSPEDMDLEEVRGWAQTRASFQEPSGSQLGSEQPTSLFPLLIQDIARLQRCSLRHSRQLEVPRPYIAARFSVLPHTFHPGDQKQYGGFDNRGLEPGHRYVLFVLAVLQKSEPVSPEWCLPTSRVPGAASVPRALASEPDADPPSSLRSELSRGEDLRLRKSQAGGFLEERTLEQGL